MGATLTLPVQVVTGDAVPVRLDGIVDKEGKKLALKTELKPVPNLKAVQREWVTIFVDGKATYHMSIKVKVQNRKIKQVAQKAVVTERTYLEMPLPVNGKFPIDELSGCQIFTTEFSMDEVAKKGSLVHAFQPMSYTPKYPVGSRHTLWVWGVDENDTVHYFFAVEREVVETLTEKMILANAQALNRGKKNSNLLMKTHTTGSIGNPKSKTSMVTEDSDDVSMTSAPTEDSKSVSDDSVSHAAIPDTVMTEAPTTTQKDADKTVNLLKIAVGVEFLIILILAAVVVNQWNLIANKPHHTDL